MFHFILQFNLMYISESDMIYLQEIFFLYFRVTYLCSNMDVLTSAANAVFSYDLEEGSGGTNTL